MSARAEVQKCKESYSRKEDGLRGFCFDVSHFDFSFRLGDTCINYWYHSQPKTQFPAVLSEFVNRVVLSEPRALNWDRLRHR